MTREELETKYLIALAHADMKHWRPYMERMATLVLDRDMRDTGTHVNHHPKLEESHKRLMRA
jgi:hypothetical protein